jgi:hypothetical protein
VPVAARAVMDLNVTASQTAPRLAAQRGGATGPHVAQRPPGLGRQASTVAGQEVVAVGLKQVRQA